MHIDPHRIAPALTLVYRAWIRSIRYDDGGRLLAVNAAADSGRSVLLAIWHAELFALVGYGIHALPGRVATVVSDSRDGELIAQVLQRIGFATARGSSTRGGLKALLGLKRHIEQGRIGVLTVDGPRGPRHKVKNGAIFLAHHLDAVLFPVRSRPSAVHSFSRSWDRFELPLPFCRCDVLFGTPLEFPGKKATSQQLEEEGRQLEAAMAATLESPFPPSLSSPPDEGRLP